MLDARNIVASNIKLLIAEAGVGFTRDVLVQRAGIGRRSLSKIEAGEVYPQLDTLGAIAKVFRIEPWRLVAPNLGRDLVSRRELQQTTGISELAASIAEHMERDPPLRDAVLALMLRYDTNPKEGAEIAEAIKTLVSRKAG